VKQSFHLFSENLFSIFRDGKLQGYEVEIWSAFAKKYNYQIAFKNSLTWNEMPEIAGLPRAKNQIFADIGWLRSR